MKIMKYLAAVLLLSGCGSTDDFAAELPDGAVPLGPAPSYEEWLTSEGGDTVSKANNNRDADHATTIVLHEGYWGQFATRSDYCPAGSFAYRINQKFEAYQGSGDDTATNAISLHCFDRTTGAFTAYATSDQGRYGTWRATAHGWPESVASPMRGGTVGYQPSMGSSDDWAVMDLQVDFIGAHGANVPGEYMWRDPRWDHPEACPTGTAVCGIKTQVEPSQGSGDDTSLNGVAFECCYF